MWGRKAPEVYSITAAPTSRADDVSDRTRRYLISMTIRTACFVGAVVVHGPLRWVLLVGALILPYLAVVAANAARSSRPGTGLEQVAPQERPHLEPRGPEQHEDGPSHPPEA